jgi:hypothetical protein
MASLAVLTLSHKPILCLDLSHSSNETSQNTLHITRLHTHKLHSLKPGLALFHLLLAKFACASAIMQPTPALYTCFLAFTKKLKTGKTRFELTNIS